MMMSKVRINPNCKTDHVENNSSSMSNRIALPNGSYLFNGIAVKSHGTITFRRNHSNKATFIRITPDTCPERVKDFFIERYLQKRPALVVSITGSAKEYGINSILFRIFRQGLLKIAKTTDVWILTNGINSNTTKLLGEIIRTNPYPSEPIHLIGIAPWASVAGVNRVNVHGTNLIYSKSKNDEKDQRPLEPNHTDFIFIDDETKIKYGDEIEFRTRFERVISDEHNPLKTMTDQSGGILVVLIVIEGGLETIKKVHQSVVENKIPVVFVEDTGGCCDLFVKCYQFYHEYHCQARLGSEESSLLDERNQQIKNKVRDKLQIFDQHSSTGFLSDQDDGIDYFELIYQCVERRNLFLNFIDLKLHTQLKADLDLVILQALLKVTSEMNVEQRSDQFKLAFRWKRIDIVKNFIMKDEKDWKTMDLNHLFEKALIENRTQFVQLFLEHDFSLEDFLDHPGKLLNLYQIENYDFKVDLTDPLRSIYSEIIQPMIGEFFQVNSIFTSDNSSTASSDDLQSIDCSSSSLSVLNDIDKELFLWSVLTGRQELAFVFWSRGRNKVCAALIAMLILKKKAREEEKIIYNIRADEFQKLAVHILDKFYAIHPIECTKAIIREIPQFGNVTWLHLAVMAEAKYFIAQRAVQDVLNDIWYGRIDQSIGNGLIIFSTIMLWYSAFLPYNKELVVGNDQSKMNDDFEEEVLNNYQCHASRATYTTNKVPDGTHSKSVGDVLDQENKSVSLLRISHWKRMKILLNQYLDNIFMFLHAPCVKYLYNLYYYVIFLMLFSYVILCDFFPLYEFESDRCQPGEEHHNNRKIASNNATSNRNSSLSFGLQPHDQPSISEIILALWIFTLFCEEIRQWISIEVPSMYRKTRAYLAVFWNKLDVLATSLFFVAFILRFVSDSQCFCVARILLAIDLSLWYIRALQMFSAVRRLGPKLVMIEEMAYDLKFFRLMLTVFVLAFGVPTYSLIHGVQEFSWHIPRAILNTAYWQVFGELEVLDEIEKNYHKSGYVVFILLTVYMIVASVLLINLLIAMFSNTFDRLKKDTDCIWKFQRYFLVCHHLTRPSFPPPLILVCHIYRAIVYVFSHIWKTKCFYDIYLERKARGKFKIIADEMLTKKIEIIEDALGNEVYLFSLRTDRKLNDRENELQEEQLHSSEEIILNKIKTLENQVQTIQNQQMNMLEYLEYLMNGMKKMGGEEIDLPRRYSMDSKL